jgi:hypothetical protein
MSFLKIIRDKYAIVALEEEHEEHEVSEDEPDDDDIFIEPTGQLGSKLNVSVGHKHIGTFNSHDAAEKAIVDWINKNKWAPNIWMISDHGNISPYSLEKKFADKISL